MNRLGIMLGSKLYYGFSEKNFDETFSRLMVEINAKNNTHQAPNPIPIPIPIPIPASPSPSSMQV
jgi:hypothetical protein